MASYPPAQCCTVGVKHEGETSGSMIRIDSNIGAGSHLAYVASANGPRIHKETAILLLPDVIGIWANSQLIADQFACNGYHTVLLDIFNGDPMKLNEPPADFTEWMSKGSGGNNSHLAPAVDPIVEAAIKHLKSSGFTKIGAVGYCFGAKYVVRFLAEGKGVDVGYVAHPSFVTNEELTHIAGPFSISAAETDHIFPTEKRHESEALLRKTKQPYQINLFSGVKHGFAVRCDLSVSTEKFAKEQAFYQAVAWFDMWLAAKA